MDPRIGPLHATLRLNTRLFLNCLDGLSDEAKAIGAVNTVVREGARLIGHNTDWIGAVRALEEALPSHPRRHPPRPAPAAHRFLLQ